MFTGVSILFFLFLLSIVFPTSFILVKMILLVSLLFIILLRLNSKNELKFSKSILLLSLFYAAVGILWSLYGALNEVPGAFSVLTVMVVYPLMFLLLTVVIKFYDIHRFFKLFLLSFFLIVLIQGSFILSSLINFSR
jgi:hypothetical protein